MNQKAVRIIALFLAIIMAGGVLIVAFSNLAGAVDVTETTAAATETAAAVEEAPAVIGSVSPVPATGTEGVPKAPVIIGIVAVLLIVGCVVVPKIAKK